MPVSRKKEFVAAFLESSQLLLLLMVSGLFATVHAATYYVDNSGSPPSSDSPTYGSEARPWRTINYGVGQISGGDVLLVKNGIYAEDGLYIFGPAGTAATPTTLKAYPGHHPVFKGIGNTGRIAIDNTGYITIDGLEIWNLNHCVYVRNGAHHVTIQNCNIHDSGNELCHVDTDSHDVLFQNNLIHDGGTIGNKINGEGIYVGNDPDPIDHTYNVIIRSNLIYNTSSEGVELKPGTHDCVVEYNTISTNNTGAVPAASIEADEARNYAANPNHVVRNNIVHDGGSQSHGIRAGTGCTIYNNIIYNISSPKYAINVDNSAGDTHPRRIYHNTLDVAAARAVHLGGGAADVRNNIGPTTAGNLATSPAYYVNATSHDYHLVRASAPVDAGVDIAGVVTVDFDGYPRPSGLASDLGAYEYIPAGGWLRLPGPPTGNNLVLDFSGDPGERVVLEAKTDLVNAAWLPLVTNTADSAGVIRFTDLEATNDLKFYQTRLLP